MVYLSLGDRYHRYNLCSVLISQAIGSRVDTVLLPLCQLRLFLGILFVLLA